MVRQPGAMEILGRGGLSIVPVPGTGVAHTVHPNGQPQQQMAYRQVSIVSLLYLLKRYFVFDQSG